MGVVTACYQQPQRQVAEGQLTRHYRISYVLHAEEVVRIIRIAPAVQMHSWKADPAQSALVSRACSSYRGQIRTVR